MAELTLTTFLTVDGVRSNTTSKGVVVSVYRRGGSLKIGSFALD